MTVQSDVRLCEAIRRHWAARGYLVRVELVRVPGWPHPVIASDLGPTGMPRFRRTTNGRGMDSALRAGYDGSPGCAVALAGKLGVTKNTVIGRAYRMGLGTRRGSAA